MSTDFWKRKREGLVEVMMKRVAILAVLAFVVPPLVLAAQAENDSAKAYKQKARRLPVEERVRLAMETIQASRDESVLGEAAWDLSLFAFSPEDAGAGLPVVESLIRRTDERTEVYGRANLAKARLLFRLGKKEESVAVFRRALNEQWYRYSYREFQETLRENGENIRAATEEYNVRAGDGLSDEILVFHGIPRDFLDMLAPLLALEVADEEFSAMQEVFPALNESTRRPLARRIGKTICLLADASYDQAIVELEDLEDVAGAGESPRFVYEGSRDIPLYLAAVLFFEGRDYDAAREAFRAYMDRNAEKPPLVLKRALRLMYAMEYRQEDMRKIGELAEFLVRSELMTNEQIRAGLPEGNVASLLNMYRRGLWWQNRLEEAEVVAFQIMDEYYPHTLASGDAVMNLAAYMFLLHDDIDAAERLLDDLIQDPPCDGILPFALVSRAGLAKERGEHQESTLAGSRSPESNARFSTGIAAPLQRRRTSHTGSVRSVSRRLGTYAITVKEGNYMNKIRVNLAWVGEILLILGIFAAIPSLHKALSHDHDLYYDWVEYIQVDRLPAVSTNPDRGMGGSYHIAVFTQVRFSWVKGHEIGDNNYYADKDTKYDDGAIIDIPDQVEYKVWSSKDGTIQDWTNDESSSSEHGFHEELRTQNTPASEYLKVTVSDLEPHYSPGTTNDPSDYESDSYTVTWVAPSSETSEHRECDQNNGWLQSHHFDTYRMTLSESHNVSFNNLWIHEVLEEVSDSCDLTDGFDTATAQINQNNQYDDELGKRGSTWDDNSGCTLQAKQTIYLRRTENDQASQIKLYENTLNWKFSPGGGWEDFISQRVTGGNTAQCPDW